MLGLGVLLHETLHETGPVALKDIRRTRSGRAFEEGFTEAVAGDLLRRRDGARWLRAPAMTGRRGVVGPAE